MQMEIFKISLLCIFSVSIFSTSIAIDTISATQSIRDGGETLVSAGGLFELGFFSPGSSKNRYVGIWYKKISNGTVIWVGNRETPLVNSSGVLKFDDKGSLVLLNQDNLIIWSINTSVVQNPVAQLLDSGNFVIRNGGDPDKENFLWQSFEHPDKTFMPGMKIGKLAGGLDIRLTSWKSVDDPSQGDYNYGVDSSGLQIKIKQNSVVTARSGPWNGMSFSGTPFLKTNQIYTFSYVFNQSGTYYTYEQDNSSVPTRLVLSSTGIAERFTWIERTSQWTIFSSSPADNCDNYAFCGPHGRCDISNSPVCSCLNKFVPKSPRDWEGADFSGGCVRRTPLDCEKGDGFVKYPGVKLPDMLNYSMNASMTLKECEMTCLRNCSCMAYANTDIRGSGSGCFLWFGELIDIKQYDDGNGQDLYIRLASSELDSVNGGNSKHKRRKVIIASVGSLVGILLLFVAIRFCIRRRRKRKPPSSSGRWEKVSKENWSSEKDEEDIGLPNLDFSTIAIATDNFSYNNLIGEGGFGPVYKGVLKDGQEVAIKRLSKDSTQGLNEFKNEVKCIAKLQHRNLVKLLGYCIQHEEKILIYEYMPNKSLNFYIFDNGQSKLVDWTTRFRIINGISRGLLYLHQDSRLRIIHRDLKLSNILLDKEMNPKISDFGMARSFRDNETAANTVRVVGTYGYMSPEYAIDGLFSIKSDVYSFGVLVLEIISGKRNRGFSHPDHDHNLLGHAWQLFKERRQAELIDEIMIESCNLTEVLRSIHIGLLCVQNSPEDRPNMSYVVAMLTGERAMPEPKEPGFFTARKLTDQEFSLSKNESCSVNEVTITMMEVR